MENKKLRILTNGIIRENPILVLILGTCPFLATTTQASNAIGMGAAVTFVLLCSNVIISLLRRVISEKVRIPCYIVIIASFVTLVQMIVKAYIPSLNSALGLYLPLIVVNCIILGRAESYASKNGPMLSLCDGIGMGLGFTFALTCIGLVREILGSGQAFGFQLLPLADRAAGTPGFTPFTIFVLAPGAFFVLAFLVAIQNAFREYRRQRGMRVTEPSGCLAGDCANCQEGVCQDPEKKQIFFAGLEAESSEETLSTDAAPSEAAADQPKE